MQRYPTTQEGLAVPVTELGFEEMPESLKRTQGHHLYFEREWYSRPRFRQVFRNLVGHVVRMRPVDHQTLHERFAPPLMMRDYQIIGRIDELIEENGLLVVHKERKLRETYQILPQEWEHIREGM